MSKIGHDTVAAAYRKEMSTFNKPWFESCSNFLREHNLRNKECLDLCAGNGEFSTILKDHFNMDVTCADYVLIHLQQAEQNNFPIINIDLDGEESEVDAIADQYRENFDIVFSLATIEHVFNSDNLLRFAHTVLKPDGLLIVNTPNISFLGYRILSLLGGNRPFLDGHHVRFWNFRFLQTNVFLNGFRVKYDRRGFFTLPEDTLKRAFRGKVLLAKIVSLSFKLCSLLQHIPFLKDLCCDELTMVCEKEHTVPLGFDYLKTKIKLENCSDSETKRQMVTRLGQAYRNGWLKEHLYFSRLAEKYMEGR